MTHFRPYSWLSDGITPGSPLHPTVINRETDKYRAKEVAAGSVAGFGRLLLKREGYELDIERIIEHAKASGCHFEINSSPDRLDLSDEHAKMAKEAGVKIAVNTDAHSSGELDFISAGINQARRAWLEPGDALNAQPLKKLLSLLRR